MSKEIDGLKKAKSIVLGAMVAASSSVVTRAVLKKDAPPKESIESIEKIIKVGKWVFGKEKK